LGALEGPTKCGDKSENGKECQPGEKVNTPRKKSGVKKMRGKKMKRKRGGGGLESGGGWVPKKGAASKKRKTYHSYQEKKN